MIQDWITSPPELGVWGTKLNAWMGSLVRVVGSLQTTVSLLQTNRIGYAAATLTSFNSGTTTAAATAMSVTAYSLQAGKRYKVSFSTHLYGTSVGATARLRIVGPSSSPVYASFDVPIVISGIGRHVSGFFYFTPATTGDQTFFLQYFRAAGSGAVSVFADTTRPTFMTAEPLQ